LVGCIAGTLFVSQRRRIAKLSLAPKSPHITGQGANIQVKDPGQSQRTNTTGARPIAATSRHKAKISNHSRAPLGNDSR
jgi:hypothetical protein